MITAANIATRKNYAVWIERRLACCYSEQHSFVTRLLRLKKLSLEQFSLARGRRRRAAVPLPSSPHGSRQPLSPPSAVSLPSPSRLPLPPRSTYSPPPPPHARSLCLMSPATAISPSSSPQERRLRRQPRGCGGGQSGGG